MYVAKQNEKKGKYKDVAFKLKKIEELRKNSSKPDLVVTDDNSDDGNMEVWSIELEDDEVHKTTHGDCLMIKVEKKNSGGRYFMVKSVCSENWGYFIDDATVSDACFSTKKVKEHVTKCEKVIDKAHSILKSLDITVSHFDTKLLICMMLFLI